MIDRRQPRWPKHRVGFVQGGHARLHDRGLDLEVLCDLGLSLGVVGQELVQRWVQQTHGDGQALHGFEDAFEVFTLVGQQLFEGGFAVGLILRQDHFPHRGDAITFEEHVLGAAEADAFGTEFAGTLGVGGAVGIGPHVHGAVLVGPFHDGGEVAGHLGFDGAHFAGEDFAGATIDREHIFHAVGLAVDGDLLFLFVDGIAPAPATQHLPQPRATTAAWQVMPPVEVRMPAALCMPSTSSGLVSLRISRTFSPAWVRSTASSAENASLPNAAPGEAGRPTVSGGGLLLRRRVKRGQQQLRQVTGRDPQHGGFFGDQLFLHHVAGDLHGRGAGPLTVPCLEHVELAALDGELDVLHILVMLFEDFLDLHQLGVDLLADGFIVGCFPKLGHVLDGLGRADAGDDVFALGS